MPKLTSSMTGRRILGAFVVCGAVLGIASMIHPTDSNAVPEMVNPGMTVESPAHAVSLGTLTGPSYSAELLAGTPEATVDVFAADGTPLGTGLTLEELLREEYRFLPVDTEPAEVWPEAFMDVDVPTDAW